MHPLSENSLGVHFSFWFMGYVYIIGSRFPIGHRELIIYRIDSNGDPHHCMGPRGISVHFVVDLYRGDRFVAATNHTVKMCIYSSIDYVWTLTSQ